MTHQLELVEHWVRNDSKAFEFTVTEDGSPRDITQDNLEWMLIPVGGGADSAVLTDASQGVSIIREDEPNGEWHVRVAEDVADFNGLYEQRAIVDPPNDTKQTWTGEVYIQR